MIILHLSNILAYFMVKPMVQNRYEKQDITIFRKLHLMPDFAK